MHNYKLCFTQKGKCYWLKVYKNPESAKKSKGRAIQNMWNIDADDKVNAFIRVKQLQDPEYNIDRIYQHTALVFHRGNRLVLGRGIFFLGEVSPHAIAMRRTSQQIVTGHIVIGGGAHQEVQSAFPDSLLIVGKQRLGDAKLGRGQLLADPALFAQ